MKYLTGQLLRIQSKPPIKAKWLLLLLLILFIPQVFISYQIVEKSNQTDLHSRIIGSRLMQADHSPYFYQWKQGDAIRLLDPNITMPYELNGVTATPFFLWLQNSIAQLNYCDIKVAWWFFTELLLFATLFFTCLIPATAARQVASIVIGILFFCYSRNWWQHVFSGQYYIVFAFVFAFISFLFFKRKKWALVAIPLSMLVRPFFILTTVAFLFDKRNYRWMVVGGVFALSLFFISGSYKWMTDYTSAMKLYAAEITGWQAVDVQSNAEPAAYEPCVMKQPATSAYGAGCLFSLQHYMKLLGIKLSNATVFSCLLLGFIVVFILILRPQNINNEPAKMLLTAFMIYIISELFTPANRNPYNMVQYLGIIGVFFRKASARMMLLFVVGICLNHDLPFRFIYQRELGELLMLMSIFFVVMDRGWTLKIVQNETSVR